MTTALALIPRGTAWVICSLGRGWSGWQGQVGLRDAAAGWKGELESGGLPGQGAGEQKTRDLGWSRPP